MGEIWIYTILSVLFVSAVSLIGILTVYWNQKRLSKILIFLVSLAAGTLLGDAFLHLIPEAMMNSEDFVTVSVYILSGIVCFFILEKFIKWRHCHEVACENHPHAFSRMILVGDTFHNFLDGIIIASSYLVSIPIGIATTIAVIFHEIPQEIGDFGSLIYGGFSRKKALFYNFLTALTAIIGALVVLILSSRSQEVTAFLVPFSAGGLIYIASSDIIPELHKSTDLKQSFWQLFFLILGIGIMFTLLFIG